MIRVFLLSFIIAVPLFISATTLTGSVQLDELSFDKITNKFNASLVKFDVSFPYGIKHEEFIAIAKDAKDSDELLVAEVGVKDYGEKNNAALARRFGVSKDDFPVIKLLIRGQLTPIHFDTSQSFTSNDLRLFVREKTGIYLSLPGCIKSLDMKVLEFMLMNTDERKQLLQEFEEIVSKIPNKEKSVENLYRTYIAKVFEKGDEFIKNEFARLKKLVRGKVSDEQKKHLVLRLNILQTFQLKQFKMAAKEEL